MSFRERVLQARADKMRELVERSWREILDGIKEHGEHIEDYDADSVAEMFVNDVQSAGLPWPKPTVEELREIVPSLLPHISRESLAEIASEFLPRETLAAATLQALPNLKRGVLVTLMRVASDVPKHLWFTSEDGVSEHDADIRKYAKAEAQRRLHESTRLGRKNG